MNKPREGGVEIRQGLDPRSFPTVCAVSRLPASFRYLFGLRLFLLWGLCAYKKDTPVIHFINPCSMWGTNRLQGGPTTSPRWLWKVSVGHPGWEGGPSRRARAASLRGGWGPGKGALLRRAAPKGLALLHGGKSRRATALYFLSSEPRPSLPLPCPGKRVSLAGRLAGVSQDGKG